MINADIETQRIGKASLKRSRIWVFWNAGDKTFGLAFHVTKLVCNVMPHVGFEIADAPAFVDDLMCDQFGIWLSDQKPGMPRRDFAGTYQLLYRLRQLQEPDCVCDVRPTFADDLRDFLLRAIEIVHQRKITSRFLDRIEVGALYVFDDGVFKRLGVVCFDDCNRHVVELRALGRTPPPFPSDYFEVVTFERAYDDWLDNTTLTNRCGELLKFIIGEQPSWVAWIWLQLFDRRTTRFAPDIGNGSFVPDVADQRSKTASQSRVIRHRRS